ncbi:MAG TPA: heme ABC transporter permease [Thermopetrobacter sp.]|nr:heme ABC transporter permease [Thermopetrobacter sp.]
MFNYLANPSRFLKVSGYALPVLAPLTAAVFLYAYYLALVVAPPDYQQGETVRIMFVHVPASALALGVYVFMAIAHILGFVLRHPLADAAARAAAPIGAVFTVISLITGALWGKPMWGTYWVWDARITSMFILLLLYLGYMAVWKAVDEPHRAAKIAGIVAIVGVINVPIIKFSVEWWNTLHQPASLLRPGGAAIAPEILTPLLWCMGAFALLFATLLLINLRAEVVARRVRQMELARVGSVA